MKMHPQYREARNQLRDIRRFAPVDEQMIPAYGRQWREAFEKDATGLQCVRLVDDIIERNKPLRW